MINLLQDYTFYFIFVFSYIDIPENNLKLTLKLQFIIYFFIKLYKITLNLH